MTAYLRYFDLYPDGTWFFIGNPRETAEISATSSPLAGHSVPMPN